MRGKLHAQLTINGQQIPDNPEPIFLGVTFDSSLSFGAHASRLRDRLARRTGFLRRLLGTPWASRLDLLCILQYFIKYMNQ